MDNTSDPEMFTEQTNQRRKRQAATPMMFPDEIEYTDEQRAVCGNDRGCLFDFAVTRSQEVANQNLETVEDFENTTSNLSKLKSLS